MEQQKIFVAVAGNIGTGKTTLTRLVADRFGWQPHFEAVSDNPYLADFYSDMARWSLPLQVFFLNRRFIAHQAINQGCNSAIQDRTIYEDAHVFTRALFETGRLEERDYQTYLEVYSSMSHFLNPPDLIIYLRKSVPQLENWVRERARSYERHMPEGYLEDLNRYYDEWLEHYSLGDKLILETDHLDYLKNDHHLDLVCREIFDALNQRDFLLEQTTPALPANEAQLHLV